MDLVAVVTGNRAQFMDSPVELEEGLLFVMAFKAGLRAVFGHFVLKGEDEFLISPRIDVLFSGTMAGFTSPFLRGEHSVDQRLIVRILFLESAEYNGMTNLANLGHRRFKIAPLFCLRSFLTVGLPAQKEW
jgi:hypothetical protein